MTLHVLSEMLFTPYSKLHGQHSESVWTFQFPTSLLGVVADSQLMRPRHAGLESRNLELGSVSTNAMGPRYSQLSVNSHSPWSQLIFALSRVLSLSFRNACVCYLCFLLQPCRRLAFADPKVFLSQGCSYMDCRPVCGVPSAVR